MLSSFSNSAGSTWGADSLGVVVVATATAAVVIIRVVCQGRSSDSGSSSSSTSPQAAGRTGADNGREPTEERD